MMYIQKQHAPTEVQQEIQRVKRDHNWDQVNYSDSGLVRTIFDQLDKSIIRKQLYKEQKGLCAYCMRKLSVSEDAGFPSETVIEHWMPVSKDGKKALDYENLMLCCSGGRDRNSNPKFFCCDAAKMEECITISPYNDYQMKKIRYNRDGFIIIDQDEELKKDINKVLRLNGDMDQNGRPIHDTATNLVHGRKQVYEEWKRFIERLEKKNKPVKAAIEGKIKEISEEDPYREYAGVWLYFLKRKARQLQGQRE